MIRLLRIHSSPLALDSPMRVAWADAVGVIERRVREVARDVVVVGVTGPVGAGKSTLAGLLSGCVVSTDSYLPDYERVAFELRDDPASSDLASLRAHLTALRAGRPVRVPVWSFEHHRAIGEREVASAPVVVVEGLHALHSDVRACVDVGVYVDAPREVRWARWEALEISGQRGWGVEVAREHFEKVAEPAHARFERVYRDAADVIVMNA